MTNTNLLEITKRFFETQEIDLNYFKDYSPTALSRINMLPLNYLKDKLSLDIISHMFEQPFMESRFFLQDLSYIINTATKKPLNYFMPLMLIEKARIEKVNKEAEKHHIYDMIIMDKCTQLDLIKHLYSMGVSNFSLCSDYHKQDIDLIASYQDSHLANTMVSVLCDYNFSLSPHHERDLDLLLKFEENHSKSLYLRQVATNKDSIDGIYHLIDLKTISECERPELEYALSYIATDPRSLKTSHHLYDMDKVFNYSDSEQALNNYIDNIKSKEKILRKQS